MTDTTDVEGNEVLDFAIGWIIEKGTKVSTVVESLGFNRSNTGPNGSVKGGLAGEIESSAKVSIEVK